MSLLRYEGVISEAQERAGIVPNHWQCLDMMGKLIRSDNLLLNLVPKGGYIC